MSSKNFLYIGIGSQNINLKPKDFERTWAQDLMLKINDDWNIWACDPRYYSDKMLKAIENSNWIDHFLPLDICDEWSNVPLFDAWNCTSVLEHVKKEKANNFIVGLRSKVSYDSMGYIHIDLSDHNLTHESSIYYEKKDKYYRSYLNKITKDEWLNIIDKHFVYSRCKSTLDRVSLYDVKVK